MLSSSTAQASTVLLNMQSFYPKNHLIYSVLTSHQHLEEIRMALIFPPLVASRFDPWHKLDKNRSLRSNRELFSLGDVRGTSRKKATDRSSEPGEERGQRFLKPLVPLQEPGCAIRPWRRRCGRRRAAIRRRRRRCGRPRT